MFPRRSLYALLMLLPQSDAFKTLHARLHSVPPMALLHPIPSPAPQSAAGMAAGHSAATAAARADKPLSGFSDLPSAQPKSNGGGSLDVRDRGGDDIEGSGPAESERVTFGPLLALFRARQQAHAEDEEARRATSNEALAASAGGRGLALAR